MGRQSWNIAFSSCTSPSSRFLRMSDTPDASETIADPVPDAPPTDPVSVFRKNKTKRESKRKEVQVIKEYVPDPPAPTTAVEVAASAPAPTPAPAPAATIDAESIADRVAEVLFAKMGREKADLDKTPEKVKTRPRPKPPAKKKESPPAPTTKYFGWC